MHAYIQASTRNIEMKKSLEDVKRLSQQREADLKTEIEQLRGNLQTAAQREAELSDTIDVVRRNTQQCEADLFEAMRATQVQFAQYEERQAKLVGALEEAKVAVLKAATI